MIELPSALRAAGEPVPLLAKLKKAQETKVSFQRCVYLNGVQEILFYAAALNRWEEVLQIADFLIVNVPVPEPYNARLWEPISRAVLMKLYALGKLGSTRPRPLDLIDLACRRPGHAKWRTDLIDSWMADAEQYLAEASTHGVTVAWQRTLLFAALSKLCWIYVEAAEGIPGTEAVPLDRARELFESCLDLLRDNVLGNKPKRPVDAVPALACSNTWVLKLWKKCSKSWGTPTPQARNAQLNLAVSLVALGQLEDAIKVTESVAQSGRPEESADQWAPVQFCLLLRWEALQQQGASQEEVEAAKTPLRPFVPWFNTHAIVERKIVNADHYFAAAATYKSPNECWIAIIADLGSMLLTVRTGLTTLEQEQVARLEARYTRATVLLREWLEARS